MTLAQTQQEQQTVAVVVVHGIGNQLPMDTVRALVDNVFGDKSGAEEPPTVYSRLDRDADFLDLRRLVLSPTQRRPRTEFFELYWQPTFGTGSAGAVVGWVLRLVRRTPVGPQMRQLVRTARALLVLLLLVTLAVVLLGPQDGWKSYVYPVLPAVSLLATALRSRLVTTLSTVVADASRWFAPSPADVEGRDKVRQLGLNLLEELHDRCDDDGSPRYGRIVVVGHSLGSVVAYDAIRLAFDKLRDPSPLGSAAAAPPADRQPLAWTFRTAAREASQPETPTPDVVRAEAYQQLQSSLHAEQRSVGVPWRVTDFITLGSPLTHARDLLSSKHADFERRVDENELPVCPPRGEPQNREQKWARAGKSVPVAAGQDGAGRIAFYRTCEEGPLRAHEASPFATTRWTNLYIPMTRWLGGDPVGGPLQPVFGSGVRDIPVEISGPSRVRRRRMAWPVAAHTLYWRRFSPGHENPQKDCVVRLRSSVDLRWTS